MSPGHGRREVSCPRKRKIWLWAMVAPVQGAWQPRARHRQRVVNRLQIGEEKMFGIGPSELVVVCLVALLLFGSRVPSVMRSLGKGISEFKQAMNDVTKDIDT